MSGLEPGDYIWRVRAIDAKNAVSDQSDPFKFALVILGKEQDMLLEVDDTVLQGNVVEIIGRTEPGAALILDGEQVASIQWDRHPAICLPCRKAAMGSIITGQNRRGGTATKHVQVVIP